MSRDWVADMRPASFRGVRFFVDNDSLEGGRRLKVHEFVDRDEPVIEDLGGTARSFTVRAFVPGETADADAQALFSAATAGGPALLRLHNRAPTMAHCGSVRTAFERQRLGFFGVDLTFQLIGSSASGLLPVGLLKNQMASTAVLAIEAIARGFRRDYTTVSVPGGLSKAEIALNSFIGMLSVATDTLTLTDGEDTIAKVDKLVADAPLLLANVTDKPSWSDDEDMVRDGTGAIERIGECALEIATKADNADNASEFFNNVFDAAYIERPAALAYTDAEISMILANGNIDQAAILRRRRTAVALAEQDSAELMTRTLRQIALMAYVTAIARQDFDTRAKAVTTRAQIASMAHEVANETYDDEAVVAVNEAVSMATEYLSRYIATLNPVVTVEASISLPSVFWAWNLYQDASRADELVTRNSVEHPSFMPPVFKALAK